MTCHRRAIGWLLLFVGLSLQAAWATEKSPASSTQPDRPNIILISMDTVRPDHLSCYGYSRITTPNIDQVARDGAVFIRAFAQAPYTAASHYALFTSQYPLHWLDRSDPTAGHSPQLTLTALLRQAGYTTAAFWGFSRFDNWQVQMLWTAPFQQFQFVMGDTWLRSPPDALYPALIRAQSTPYFIFLHGYDAHEPHLLQPWCDANRFDPTYHGQVPSVDHDAVPAFADQNPHRLKFDDFYREQLKHLTPPDVEHLKAVYDAQIFYADQGLGRLFTALKNLHLADRTIIVILSDHGQMFGEHGEYATHEHCYDEVIHTVLVIKDPRRRMGGAYISRTVQLIDVMPTMLELAGIPIPPGLAGRSLVPLMDTGRDEGRTDLTFTVSGPGGTASIRSPEWKLITVNESPAELYQLSKDPEERVNRVKDEPAVVRQLYARLSGVTGGIKRVPPPASEPPDLKAWLQKHGYW